MYLHTVKWFQILLFNKINSIKNYPFICSQLNGLKHFYVILMIQFDITDLLGRSWLVSTLGNDYYYLMVK